ncbi:MAG: DUF167 domain-containing protein [Candidatus Micrarchaeota archaeon]
MRVEIIVSPRSSKFLLYVQDGVVRANLRSPPEDNKANIELIKELKRATGVDVRIISGLKSKRKVIEIGIDEAKWNLFVTNLDG